MAVMDDADSLMQKAAGKRGDAERVTAQRDDLVRAHGATIEGYRKQIDRLNADISVLEGQIDKEMQTANATIAQLNSEADQFESDAAKAREHADNVQKAAIAAAAANKLGDQ